MRLADDRRQFVGFSLDDHHYAIELSRVEQVTPVVELTPLPEAPTGVLGVINVHGRVVPVVDARQRLGRAPRDAALSDQLIIARAAGRYVALLVDETDGVIEAHSRDIETAGGIFPGIGRITGVLKMDGRMTLIHDPDVLLSGDDGDVLDRTAAG